MKSLSCKVYWCSCLCLIKYIILVAQILSYTSFSIPKKTCISRPYCIAFLVMLLSSRASKCSFRNDLIPFSLWFDIFRFYISRNRYFVDSCLVKSTKVNPFSRKFSLTSLSVCSLLRQDFYWDEKIHYLFSIICTFANV